VGRLGDFEEVVRLQAGIRDWLLRTAQQGGHELRGLPAAAVPPLLCAAAFGPALAEAAELGGARAVARLGVLSSVGASALGDLVAAGVDRARSAHPAPGPSRTDLQREISQSLTEILSAGGPHSGEVRSDIAMVLREIDAGGTACRAAVESGDEELQHEVLAAAEAASAEFGELEFLLADLARAAGEIQDSLGGQGTELRTAIEEVARQSADVRVIREELAVMAQRPRRWLPGSSEPEPRQVRWAGGCPYRGLLPYGQADEAVFFGREQLTAVLAGTLAQSGLVMVTGASGAGKTSLLQAGLVPALARGVQVPGSPSWPRISMTPGRRPLTELAAQLAQLGDGDPAAIWRGLTEAPGDAHVLLCDIARAAGASRLVLIIDEFEQVFTAGDDRDTAAETPRERAAFIEAVCVAATRPAGALGEPPLLAVIAVRGDYWDRCAAHPQLIRPMAQDQVVVGPMTEAELRRVITGPAEASGLAVEPGLPGAIVADLRTAADAAPAGTGILPLLSQALAATWEHRSGGELTRQAYQDAGDRACIARAVEASAEAAYAGLTEDQQALAREIFRRLTAAGPDRKPARRAVAIAGRAAGSEDPQLKAVLEAFAGRRLLVLDAGQCEIAHDVLLQAWPRLRGWLAEDQTSMVLYGQLAEDTARWRGSGGDRALLSRGVQLAATQQAADVWAADPDRYPALSTGETEFLRASGRAAVRGRRRRQTLAGMLAVVVVAALAGAGIAVKDTRATAARQSTANTAQHLAAQSTDLDAADPVTAALLASAAWRLDPTAQARYSLLQSLAQPVRGVLIGPSGVVTALAYSPDGSTLAAGYSSGAIQLWDLASHAVISVTSFGAAPLALSFADGGKLLEAAGAATVGTWNLASHAAISTRPLASPARGSAVVFSPDGSTLATGGSDGGVRLWNADTGQEIGPPMSSDANPVDAVAFSPSGMLLAAASSDGNVQLWDTASQQVAGAALIPNGPQVDALAFSPDGKLLATGGQDGTARLWNLGPGGQAGTAMVTGEAVSALTFGTSGSTLATAESDGATELWDVATQAQTGPALAAAGSAGVSALAFSPGTDALATGNGNGSIQLWDAAGFHQAAAPLAVGPVAGPATFSAGGGLLAASAGNGAVRVWNTSSGQPVGGPLPGNGTVTGLALSPDGKTLAVAGSGVQLWQTATGQRTGAGLPPAGHGSYRAVAFSPDGTMLATFGADGTARIWNVATQREIGTPMTAGRAGTLTGAVAFSPGGKELVTVAAGDRAQLWIVATGRPLGQPMATGPATSVVAFSADGRMLVTAGGDGSARLWNAATRQEIGTPMTADAQPVYAAAFSPSGGTLVTAGGDGLARSWDVAFPADLPQAACGIAGMPLTRQQWTDYAGSQPFQQVCPTG
jgi:WD40 repeat protein